MRANHDRYFIGGREASDLGGAFAGIFTEHLLYADAGSERGLPALTPRCGYGVLITSMRLVWITTLALAGMSTISQMHPAYMAIMASI